MCLSKCLCLNRLYNRIIVPCSSLKIGGQTVEMVAIFHLTILFTEFLANGIAGLSCFAQGHIRVFATKTAILFQNS